MSTYKNRDPRETLCWYCKNAVPSKGTRAGCSWSRKFEPVSGWNADETILKCHGGYDEKIKSYLVKECPEFEKGR